MRSAEWAARTRNKNGNLRSLVPRFTILKTVLRPYGRNTVLSALQYIPSMKSPLANFRELWKPLLIAAGLAFLYATVLAKLGYDWWTDDNYSHGLLVPFVIGYVVWLKFDGLREAEHRPKAGLGLTMVGLALLMLLFGTLAAELFMQR